MKVFAALLIDGKEDGPRVPTEIWFRQESLDQKGLTMEGPKGLTLGPVNKSGMGIARFFTTETGDDFLFEVFVGPMAYAQSIHYD